MALNPRGGQPQTLQQRQHAALAQRVVNFQAAYNMSFDDPRNAAIGGPQAQEAVSLMRDVHAYEQSYGAFDSQQPPPAPRVVVPAHNPPGRVSDWGNWRHYAPGVVALLVVLIGAAWLFGAGPFKHDLVVQLPPPAVNPPPTAQLAPNQFIGNDGQVWTITGGGNGRPVSVPHLVADAAKACPHRRIILAPRGFNNNPPMTPEQKARGDKRWHPECDWSKQF